MMGFKSFVSQSTQFPASWVCSAWFCCTGQNLLVALRSCRSQSFLDTLGGKHSFFPRTCWTPGKKCLSAPVPPEGQPVCLCGWARLTPQPS